MVESLGKLFELVPICPETAIGMAVPRPPIRLQRQSAQLRAVSVDTPTLDVTLALRDYAKQVASELQNISGYVFKSASPSCGFDDAVIYDCSGEPRALGGGIFARTLMCCWPSLPVTDEQRLAQAENRVDFVDRVLSYHRYHAQIDE